MRLRLASQTRSPINARLAVQANLANARTHCRPGSWMQVNPGVDIRRHVDHGVVQRKDHPDVFAVICAFIEIILPRYADPAILGAAPEALMGTDDCCQGVIEGTRGSDRLADGLQGNERTGRCFRIIGLATPGPYAPPKVAKRCLQIVNGRRQSEYPVRWALVSARPRA